MEDRLEALRRLAPATADHHQNNNNNNDDDDNVFGMDRPSPKLGGRRRKDDEIELRRMEEGRLSTTDEDEKLAFMRDFFIEVETITDKIARIKALMKRIEEIHAVQLKSTSTAQTKEKHAEMEGLVSEATKLMQSVKESLAQMDKVNKEQRQKEGAIATVRIRETQHQSLQRQYVDVLKEFQAMQSSSKQKYADRIARQVRIVKPEVTEEELERILESGVGDNIFQQDIMHGNAAAHATAKAAYLEVVEKHRDILAIEKSLNELFDLFADLAYMIDEQQELVDSIQHNISEANHWVEKTVETMQETRQIQKKVRSKLFCILLIVAAIILGFIFFMVVLPIIIRLLILAK